MKREKKGKAKYFFGSMILSILLLSGMVLGYLYFFDPVGMFQKQKDTSEVLSAPHVVSGETLRALLAVTDDRLSPIAFFVVGVNGKQEKIPDMALSLKIQIEKDGKAVTLEQLYRSGGISGVRQAISHELGIDVQYELKYSKSQFVSLVNEYGSVDYVVPERLIDDGVFVEEGRQALFGAELYDMLRYSSYSGGELMKTRLQGELLAAFIDQRLRHPLLKNKSEQIFFSLVNGGETNLSITDYNREKQMLSYLQGLDKAIAFPIAPGIVQEGQQTYRLPSSITEVAKSYYE